MQSMGMDVTDREGAKIHAVTAQEYETHGLAPSTGLDHDEGKAHGRGRAAAAPPLRYFRI